MTAAGTGAAVGMRTASSPQRETVRRHPAGTVLGVGALPRQNRRGYRTRPRARRTTRPLPPGRPAGCAA
jgi:hypothetical protein